MIKRKCYLLCNVGIPLIAGLAIYLILCRDTYVSQWFYRICPTELNFMMPENMCIRFIRNYVCDMLWAYALMIALYSAMNNFSLVWTGLIGWCFAILVECSQLSEMISGTFDFWDIVLEGIAIGVAMIVIGILERDGEIPVADATNKRI